MQTWPDFMEADFLTVKSNNLAEKYKQYQQTNKYACIYNTYFNVCESALQLLKREVFYIIYITLNAQKRG